MRLECPIILNNDYILALYPIRNLFIIFAGSSNSWVTLVELYSKRACFGAVILTLKSDSILKAVHFWVVCRDKVLLFFFGWEEEWRSVGVRLLWSHFVHQGVHDIVTFIVKTKISGNTSSGLNLYGLRA